ncbi:uncharacterized protein LOC135193956 [Vanessa tameamea]|uniref:Uncharacterized protein LOC135193956 n=1 Tax=Vanessa tameamea TaxID=334116 RepID=A0ABM4ATL8_VANTA
MDRGRAGGPPGDSGHHRLDHSAVTREQNRAVLLNFIDQKFQAAIFPLNLFQNIFFQSKYTIRNNFVHPKSYIYNTLSFIFTVLLIYLMCYVHWKYFSFSYSFYIFILIFYDVSIICAFRYMKLIRICFELWVYKISQNSGPRYRFVRKTRRSQDGNYKKIFDSYIDFIESFELFKIIFQVPVSIMSLLIN